MSVFENLSEISVYFAHSMGTPIYNQSGVKLGHLKDFFVDYEETYPLVIALQYKRNGQYFYISWNDVESFSYKKIITKDKAFIGRSRTYPKAPNKKMLNSLLANQFTAATIEFPPLGKIILDKQVVDTSGKKVIRVNDIQFIKAGQNLRVTHAAIGFRSMVRRLGYEWMVDGFLKVVRPNARYLSSDVLINWKYVHAIPNRNIGSELKLSLSNQDIKNLHPADLADILEDLDNYGRELIFSNLDPQTAAETLSEVDPDIQMALIRNEKPEEAAKIIEMMDTDDAADILNDLSDRRADAIISNFKDNETLDEINELLEYEDDTAGGLMSTEVFEISPDLKRSEILGRIQREHEELETIYDLYVINNIGTLVGTCSLRELLVHQEDVKISDIMNKDDIKSLPPEVSWKQVASHMSKYNLINVPIIDEDQKLLGIVSVDDVLPWLLNER